MKGLLLVAIALVLFLIDRLEDVGSAGVARLAAARLVEARA